MFQHHERTVTIANGATTSDAINKAGFRLMALQVGTITGATFTFTGSAGEDDTFSAVYDDAGNQISVTATDNSVIAMTGTVGAALASIPFLKIVSAGAEGAERTITVLLGS